MGREVVVAVTGGRLDFGPWEQIFYGEFDAAGRSGCWSRSSASSRTRTPGLVRPRVVERSRTARASAPR